MSDSDSPSAIDKIAKWIDELEDLIFGCWGELECEDKCLFKFVAKEDWGDQRGVISVFNRGGKHFRHTNG